jgi:outer membrane protein assembly factor BamD (BamD/ComL family)
MPSEGSRLWPLLVCALILLGGCASVPPAPASARNSAKPGGDEDEGWLWKSLTGQKPAPAAAKPDAAAAGGVQQASATVEVPNPSGPWIPGPASPSLRGTTASATGPAMIPGAPDGPVISPPPAIPAELPPSSAPAVSIKDAKGEAEKDKEKKGFEWSDLAPENIYKNVKKAAGYGPNEQFARTTMQEGKALFAEKKYKEAAAKFATAADRWPDSPLEEDALFLQAESEFFADQYPKAHDTYGGLLKKYTNTRYLDTVAARQFALGRYWEQLQDAKPMWTVAPNMTDGSRPMFDTFGYAIQAYERVRLNDPTGPLADASLMAMGNAYFRYGQYENAAYNYDLLRKEYPNSKYQTAAHVLGLQAKMRMYQGTMYSGIPLNDAKKIADQALTQYGDKLGNEREHVAQARAQIVEEQANRDFALAEYYAQHKYYGAARMYYQGVIKDFPGTEKAREAQTRIEKIRNEPDSPPNHFKWLTDMFDSKRD